ncbi:hypothetical protein F4860DRAFT_98199 [Xylaria cubensis]|nr:hypothetical protein F4860DRAFT_98199 [Xylaria cubensis]
MPHLLSGKGRPSIADLEQAALSVIHLMQGVAGLANIRIALIGDLAVKKYLEQPGSCESIEFITTSASPSQVKKTLLSHGKGIIAEKAQAIFYRHPTGWVVEIKITPEWLCPYLPSSAQPVADIKKLPYISLADLFVFKADACGLHESTAGRQRQVRDAGALLELASEHFPLKLEEDKLQKVEEALDTLVDYSPPEYDRRWWERRLGKQQNDKRRSVQDILSELGEGLRLDEEENRRTARRPSVFSLSNRGSESSISSTPSISSQGSTPLSSPPPPKMRPRKMSVSGSYPRPRRHTQMDSQPEYQPAPPAHQSFRDINRLYAESMDISGRSSPGISLMTFPGKGR